MRLPGEFPRISLPCLSYNKLIVWFIIISGSYYPMVAETEDERRALRFMPMW
jgi:hypothetical protein